MSKSVNFFLKTLLACPRVNHLDSDLCQARSGSTGSVVKTQDALGHKHSATPRGLRAAGCGQEGQAQHDDPGNSLKKSRFWNTEPHRDRTERHGKKLTELYQDKLAIMYIAG